MKYLNIVCLIILLNLLVEVTCVNKYSKEANKDVKKEKKNDKPKLKKSDDNIEPIDFRPVSLKHLDRPFRMAKLNLLWSKAVLVSLKSYLKSSELYKN